MSTYISLSDIDTPRNSVYTNSVKINYYTDDSGSNTLWTYDANNSGWFRGDYSYKGVPDSNPARYYRIWVDVYHRYATSGNGVTWIFPDGTQSNSASGTNKIITGLSSGSQEQITCSVSFGTTYYQTGIRYEFYLYNENQDRIYNESIDMQVPEFNNEWHSIPSTEPNPYQDPAIYSSEEVSSGGSIDSNTLTVYTRPGIFTEFDSFSGGENGTVIESAAGLTVGKVNRWMAHCNKFAHWWNQNGNDVTGNIPQVNAGDLIKASWYNACVAACANSATRPPNVTANVTYITPKVFSDLGVAISADDNTSVS